MKKIKRAPKPEPEYDELEEIDDEILSPPVESAVEFKPLPLPQVSAAVVAESAVKPVEFKPLPRTDKEKPIEISNPSVSARRQEIVRAERTNLFTATARRLTANSESNTAAASILIAGLIAAAVGGAVYIVQRVLADADVPFFAVPIAVAIFYAGKHIFMAGGRNPEATGKDMLGELLGFILAAVVLLWVIGKICQTLGIGFLPAVVIGGFIVAVTSMDGLFMFSGGKQKGKRA